MITRIERPSNIAFSTGNPRVELNTKQLTNQLKKKTRNNKRSKNRLGSNLVSFRIFKQLISTTFTIFMVFRYIHGVEDGLGVSSSVCDIYELRHFSVN